jgi:glycosyltransferase involved in cell wall biosynthesis
MAEVYKHEYLPVSVYGNVVGLLREHGATRGVHLDVGCGYGAIAEPVAELGLTYLGFDLAEDGLTDLRGRGFEGWRIDLADPAESERTIRSAVNDRPIASITFMDTLEHITNGAAVVAMLRRLATADEALLVLSVPNVAHKDIALKLLVGRWDVTEAGLLDYTHVEFYTRERMRNLFASTGWREIGAKDWLIEHSDQKFPTDIPLLHPETPIGGFLRALIDRANPYSIVNQFVRAFRPTEPEPVVMLQDRREPARPLLSILLLAFAGEDVAATLADLSAQTNCDFELEVLAPDDAAWQERTRKQFQSLPAVPSRISILNANSSPWDRVNEIFLKVAGKFVVVLWPTDRLEPQWIESLADLAVNGHSSVLTVTRIPGLEGRETNSFAHIPALAALAVHSSRSVAEFALPGGLFRHLGMRADADLGDFALRALVTVALLFCGAHTTANRLVSSQDLGQVEKQESYDALLKRVAELPILLPAGSAEWLVRSFRWYEDKHHELVSEIQSARVALEQLKERERALALFGDANRLAGEARLLGEFLQKYSVLPKARGVHSLNDNKPFLSVVTRTQGRRLRTLRDTILSLAGQSDQDFELIVIVHSEAEADLTGTRRLVEEFPAELQKRIKIAACTRAGRSAPLNDGFALARGSYVCALDDDDFVFGHWVETFRRLAEQAPGSILRATCVRQDFEILQGGAESNKIPRALSWFKNEWPNAYDVIAHLYDNYSPFMCLAFPQNLFRKRWLRFDETISTAEDWDLTMRAAMLCGVHSSSEITAVYRWWLSSESSLFAHSKVEWTDNRDRIISRLNDSPILLPAGATMNIINLVEDGKKLQTRLEQIKNTESLKIQTLKNNISEQKREYMQKITEQAVRIQNLENRIAENERELARKKI